MTPSSVTKVRTASFLVLDRLPQFRHFFHAQHLKKVVTDNLCRSSGSDDITPSDKPLILLSTFEAALAVVLMKTEGPVSREYQTGTPSSSRSLRISSMILTDNGLTSTVPSLPVIVIACKFSVSTSASLLISGTSFLPIARLIL